MLHWDFVTISFLGCKLFTNCQVLVFAVKMLAGDDKMARHRFCEA